MNVFDVGRDLAGIIVLSVVLVISASAAAAGAVARLFLADSAMADSVIGETTMTTIGSAFEFRRALPLV